MTTAGAKFQLAFKPFPKPDGPLVCAYIPWDSDLFGFPFYELKCSEADPQLLDDCLRRGLPHLTGQQGCLALARLPPGQTGVACVLAQHGFYPVETMLDFELALTRFNPIRHNASTRYRFRNAVPGDLPSVRAIAQNAFLADRFHMDPHLPPDTAGRRYAYWVEQSFARGDQIFVLEQIDSAAVVGFIQCRDLAPGVVDVCLGAVHRDIQRGGAGVSMYRQLFVEYRARGYKKALTHVSINNLGGVKLTLGYGFTVSNATLGMHWFHPGAATAKTAPNQ